MDHSHEINQQENQIKGTKSKREIIPFSLGREKTRARGLDLKSKGKAQENPSRT